MTQRGESQADQLVQKIPLLMELFNLTSRESRDSWIRANPETIIFMGAAAYWFSKEGRWNVVRELNELELLAAESFDDSKLPSDRIDEVKERLLAGAYQNLGNLAEHDGALFKALQLRLTATEFLEQAVRRRTERGMSPFSKKDMLFGGGGDGLRASYFLKVFTSYQSLGEETPARQYERKAYDAIATSTNLDNYAVARTYEANEADRYGARKEARAILKRAIEYVFSKPFPRDGFVVPLASMVHLLLLAAGFAAEDGDLPSALEYIDQAIHINTEKRQWVHCIDCLLQRAQMAHACKNEAEMRFSMRRVDDLISEKGMEAEIPVDQLYKLRLTKAEHSLMTDSRTDRMKNLKIAERHFSGALQIVRELRARASSYSEKMSVSAQRRNAYEGMLDTLGELYSETQDRAWLIKGLRTAEQSSAQLFLERASESRLPAIQNSTAEDMATLSQLDHVRYKIAVSTYESEVVPLTPNERIARDKEFEKLIQERDSLIEWIKQKDPAILYAVAPDAVELDEIQSLLNPDQCILYYAMTEASVLGWRISNSEARLKRLPLEAKELIARIVQFREVLTEQSSEAMKSAFEIGSDLFKLVISPLLSAEDTFQRMFVISSGPLSSIPFEALVLEEKSRGRYFIEQFEITYAPSLSILALMLKSATRERVGPPWFLGLGDPKYRDVNDVKAGQMSVLQLLRKRGRIDLSRLPGSRFEVESIGQLFGPGNSRVVLGEEGTIDFLQALHLTDYAFIHFAVHGFLPGEVSGIEQAALALSPSATSDGLLTVQDATALGIRSYLTVLSACNTSMGPSIASEGMISVTRAMLSSGSDHVLASLWEVSDTATAMLMIDFYKRLLAGKRPTQALREAKLALMDQAIPVKLARAAKPSEDLSASGDQPKEQLPGRWPCFWSAFLLHGGDTTTRFVVPHEAGSLGSDRAPVKVGGAAGQRAYLSRLRSKDGTTPKWQRRGSIGVGIYGNIIDVYDIEDASTGRVASICMDMYHPGYYERRPIPGFSLTP
jgi:CHAT domain-containing protein